jgi:prepilin-type N-terminal cleavage/methylation domain-containing protein
MKTNKSGFTLLEIMIVVAIIGLLAAIAIPSFMKARTTSQQKACINNLRQIESGKEQWALEARKKQGDAIDTTAVNTYLKKTPFCPSDGIYSYNVIGEDASCSMTYPIAHAL